MAPPIFALISRRPGFLSDLGERLSRSGRPIQKLIADRFGRKVADTIHILYGGSVNKKNAGDILEKTGVDGFLVGGASLRGKEFVEIIKITGEHANN